MKYGLMLILSNAAILFCGCATQSPNPAKKPPTVCQANIDLFTFSPVYHNNVAGYTIGGSPGCVTGAYPIKVVAMNKKSGNRWENLVNEDGSFSITVKISEGDKIKYVFTDSAGRQAIRTLRIPVMVRRTLSGEVPDTVDRFGETPGGPKALLAKIKEEPINKQQESAITIQEEHLSQTQSQDDGDQQEHNMVPLGDNIKPESPNTNATSGDKPKEIAYGEPAQLSVGIDGLRYRALPVETAESAFQASATQSFIVSGKITESNLRKTLGKIYSEVSMIGGFKNHDHPNAILIFLYPEDAANDLESNWIASLDKPLDRPIRIEIKEALLKDLNAPPEMKMGLSDATRRQIYRDVARIENRVYSETDKIYPLQDSYESESERVEYINKIGKMYRNLTNKYELELTQKYKITSAQLKDIINEGNMKSWIIPKWETR